VLSLIIWQQAALSRGFASLEEGKLPAILQQGINQPILWVLSTSPIPDICMDSYLVKADFSKFHLITISRRPHSGV
jgi:hypothetical protein